MPATALLPALPPPALLTARLLAQPAQHKGDGLWLTYTGSVVRTWIPGLNADRDINLVIDLASLAVAGATIPALADHYCPVGTWSDVAIDPAASTILARLKLLDAPPESHGLYMFDRARELRLSIAQDLPWQASIGAKPGPEGSYELLTAPTMVNGRLVELSADRPTYVLRGGVLTEQSIVLFGADDATMKVAAAAATHRPNLETPMSEKPIKERLAALVARFGETRRPMLAAMLGEGHTDDEAIAGVEKEKDAELADLKTKLANLEKTNAELKEQLAALAPAGGTNTGTPPATGAGLHSTPKTLVQAQLAAVGADGKPLRGFAALRAARAANPTLPVA
jgi:hypothetical protein